MPTQFFIAHSVNRLRKYSYIVNEIQKHRRSCLLGKTAQWECWHRSKHIGLATFIFLLSLTLAMPEKVLFLGQIFEMEILMDLHFMMSPESENNIFSVGSVCMCVYVSVISITQKQITAETSNLLFCICIM